MKCSVFIATSADGYIAKHDGDIDWLHTSGNLEADMGNEDMGFKAFIESVDCMIMGRKCMEKIASFNLSAEQWPYGNIRIIVLSNTLSEAPKTIPAEIEFHSGDIKGLITNLESDGLKHAYIDGGTTITSFLELKLINEMTITQAPLLLGDGIPLYGKLKQSIILKNTKSKSFANDFVQIKYTVNYQ